LKKLNTKKDFHLFVNELIQILKPKLTFPICTTLICLGPPLHLIFDLNIKKLNLTIILSVISIFYMIYTWISFIKSRQEFRKKKIALLKLHNIIEEDENFRKEDLDLKIKSALENIF